eukprot:PhM_4_TR2783/c0_g1_i1/m.78393
MSDTATTTIATTAAASDISEYTEYLKLKAAEFKAHGDWLREVQKNAVEENRLILSRQKEGKLADVAELLRLVDASIADRRARGDTIDEQLLRDVEVQRSLFTNGTTTTNDHQNEGEQEGATNTQN